MRTFIATLLLLLSVGFAHAGSMPLIGAGKPPTVFTPASLPNLRLWAEANQQVYTDTGCTTPAGNGDPVGCMKDLSGNSFDLTAAASRPSLVISAGKSALAFTAAGFTCLSKNADLGIYSHGSGSVFIAIQSSSPPVGTVILGGGKSDTNIPLMGWIETGLTTASTFRTFIRNDANVPLADGNIVTNAFESTAHVVGFTWDGATVQGYKDGAAASTLALASGSTITITTTALGCLSRIGQAGSTTANVAGIVATHSVLSAGEIAQVTAYLAALQ